MIRVLQIGLTSNIGGTETFIMNLYRNIDREKIQFDFLVEHTKKLPFEDEILSMGGKVYYDYYFLRDKKKKGYISPEEFLKRHPEINAIHINAQEPNTLVRFLTAAKKQNIKCRIFHSHNVGYIQGQNIKQKIYEIYARDVIRRDSIEKLACSKEAAKFMFGNTHNTKVIPNAIDAEKFSFNEQVRIDLRKELGIAKDDIVVGFVGSFNYQKNVLFILDILKELIKVNQHYKVLMIGAGKFEEEFSVKAKELGIAKNVICIGNRKNVNQYMNTMDLFLFPSRWEGFGIVLLEAQASGLKCFTSKDVVPIDTNVTGNVKFISLEKTPKEWADEILSTNLERYEGKNIIENSEYNMKNLVELMQNIYQKYEIGE